MKRAVAAVFAALAVNVCLFLALARLNEKEPAQRELLPVAHIHYTPVETLSREVPDLAEPAPQMPEAPPLEPMPQSASSPPPRPIAESAIQPEMKLEIPKPQAADVPEAPAPLPPIPLDAPGLELPELASPPSLMTPRPPPPEPVAESASPPPQQPPPPPPPPEPVQEIDIVFTPDGFIAVENITAALPSVPAYIEPDARSFGPPPPSPPSSGPNRAPEPIHMADPIYPSAARRRGIEGSVTVRIHIDTSGDVSDVDVIDVVGHHSFRDSVLKAVRKWQFTPALENGLPVAAWGERTIHFRRP